VNARQSQRAIDDEHGPADAERVADESPAVRAQPGVEHRQSAGRGVGGGEVADQGQPDDEGRDRHHDQQRQHGNGHAGVASGDDLDRRDEGGRRREEQNAADEGGPRGRPGDHPGDETLALLFHLPIGAFAQADEDDARQGENPQAEP
jgi:hypothetical protein